MSSSPIGLTFASLMGLGPVVATQTATRAEALGYGSFWTAEEDIRGP
ncbi:MAG: hypothetical protein AAGK32_08180 [Actinomycetota bacterium]